MFLPAFRITGCSGLALMPGCPAAFLRPGLAVVPALAPSVNRACPDHRLQAQDAGSLCHLRTPLPRVCVWPGPAALLTFPTGTCWKPRLCKMRSDWVREKAVKP